MTSDKALSTVEKLVRVAAPNSGATEHERTSAATHACKLIVEHNLVITTREKQNASRGPRMSDLVNIVMRTAAARQPNISPYRKAIAAEDCECGIDTCDSPIFQGETVWRRTKGDEIEYVHADCWTH